MDEVLRLRRQIDQIDLEIIGLLKDRYESARYLGRIKRARHLSLRDPRRESIIIQKMDRVSRSLRLRPALVRAVYKQIFALAIDAQKKTNGSSRELKGLKVLVIGGTGGMGRLFAQLMRLQGASVKIVGQSQSHAERVAKDIAVEAGTLEHVKTSDIVIISVPIEKTRQVALATAAKMRENSLLVDLSSVKTGIANRIAVGFSGRKEFVSLHPLFSPEIRSLTHQNVVAIPFNPGPIWARFSKALMETGARMEISSMKRHDLTMSYVQVIHHFALLSLGVSLNNWNGEFRTNSLAQTEARIRSLLRNWSTIAAIQHQNPYAQQARDHVVSTVNRLRQMKPSDDHISRRVLTVNVQKWTRKT